MLFLDRLFNSLPSNQKKFIFGVFIDKKRLKKVLIVRKLEQFLYIYFLNKILRYSKYCIGIG